MKEVTFDDPFQQELVQTNPESQCGESGEILTEISVYSMNTRNDQIIQFSIHIAVLS